MRALGTGGKAEGPAKSASKLAGFKKVLDFGNVALKGPLAEPMVRPF